MDRDFDGMLVFGESRASAVASLREQAAQSGRELNLVEWEGRGPIGLPEFAQGRVTISFSGFIPVKWLGRDLQSGWLQHLLEGTGLEFDVMGRPEIRCIGNQEDNAFMLLLHWEAAGSEVVRTVAAAIARSYRERAGMTMRIRR
jgi:hypothetical protein